MHFYKDIGKHFQISSQGLDMGGDPTLLTNVYFQINYRLFIIHLYSNITILEKSLTSLIKSTPDEVNKQNIKWFCLHLLKKPSPKNKQINKIKSYLHYVCVWKKARIDWNWKLYFLVLFPNWKNWNF